MFQLPLVPISEETPCFVGVSLYYCYSKYKREHLIRIVVLNSRKVQSLVMLIYTPFVLSFGYAIPVFVP